MPHAIDVTIVEGDFAVSYDDGTVTLHSPEDFAKRMKRTFVHHDVKLEMEQLDAIAAISARTGETLDEYVESAILEKLLRGRTS